MNVNKINYISKDHRNNKDDIESDIEYRVYKRFYNKLISLEQVFKSDIIIFNKYKTSVGFYENKL